MNHEQTQAGNMDTPGGSVPRGVGGGGLGGLKDVRGATRPSEGGYTVPVEEAWEAFTDAVRALKEECRRVEQLLILCQDLGTVHPPADLGDLDTTASEEEGELCKVQIRELDRLIAAEQQFDAARRHYERELRGV